MTPIEKQILENQKSIMFTLRDSLENEEIHTNNFNILNKNIEITKYLLNPTKEENACDMRETKGCGKMFCLVCDEEDKLHSAYCSKHQRSTHYICGEDNKGAIQICDKCAKKLDVQEERGVKNAN
ncbi:hypothetical protein LCGC14_0465690 [marine sediment metagenome]|uniref:Uncharacterized protein n=1 Tax=marine sediment metagenome TaxID=412755 RepID=A0A0F9SDS7_9ZZZZ